MKKIYFLIAVFFTVNVANSQIIFSEDFDLGMPASWTTANIDGLTPDPNVAQFTDAWIVAEDFDNIGVGDSVAMSTSWYNPPGTSDDWLMTPPFTLTTNNVLTWDEEGQDAGFPDGYEVYISTSAGASPVPGDFTGVNGAMIFSTPASSPAVWLTRTVDLQALGYANQSVSLAWRNNATNQFILMINNVLVEVSIPFDVSTSNSINLEYPLIPISQAEPIGTEGTIANVGSSTVTNATLNVDVFDGGLNNVYSASATPAASLAPATSITQTVAGFTPTLPDVYTVQLVASITETDGNLSNDTTVYTVTFTDSTYARDNGVATGALGVGAGAGTNSELGQSFELTSPDTLTSVDVFITNTGGIMTGQPLSCRIYSVINGTIGSLLGETDTIVVDTSANTLWNLTIAGGPLELTVDTFAILAQESGANLTVGLAADIFTLGTTFINWSGNPSFPAYANNEDFAFNSSYILRANFGIVPVCSPTSSTITQTACNNYTTPSGAVFTSSGTVMDTIMNVGGCDSIITINLTINNMTTSTITEVACNGYTAPSGANFTSSGTVMDTIMNIAGCDSVITINLTVNTVNTSTTNVQDTITADMAGATYQWIDCNNGDTTIVGATGQMFIASVNGDYAVIVSSNGCSDTSACVNVLINSIPDRLAELQNTSVFPNPSNGQFTLMIEGVSTPELKVEIIDISGKIILTKIMNDVNSTINVPLTLNVPSGNYFIQLTAEGVVETKPLIITK